MATVAATTMLAESFSTTDNKLITDTSTTTTGDDTIAFAHLNWDKISADNHELRFHYWAHKKVNAFNVLHQQLHESSRRSKWSSIMGALFGGNSKY